MRRNHARKPRCGSTVAIARHARSLAVCTTSSASEASPSTTVATRSALRPVTGDEPAVGLGIAALGLPDEVPFIVLDASVLVDRHVRHGDSR